MKNQKRYWSISGGFHRRTPVGASFAKPDVHTHTQPSTMARWLWTNPGIADRLEDNSVYSEDQDNKVDLSPVPAGTGLLLMMEQRAWREGQGKGQQQADVRAALFMNREQGRNSHWFSPCYQRMNVFWIGSFIFLFILSDVQVALHIKTRRKFQK